MCIHIGTIVDAYAISTKISCAGPNDLPISIQDQVTQATATKIFLTAKLLSQGYRYYKIHKHFLNSTTATQS